MPQTVVDILCFTSAILFGLLAGAVLFVTLVLVPYWLRLTPANLRGWVAENRARIATVMYPLGLGAGLASVAALVAARAGPRFSWLVAATGAGLAVGLVTRLVNEPINQKLAGSPPLTDEETIAVMRRWNSWNWLRLVLALVGFCAALRALQAGGIPRS